MADGTYSSASASEVAKTSDERTMATPAHALQLIGGWIAPLIIFFIKRDSRFVSFHALQALLLQSAYFVLMMVVMVAVFVALIVGVAIQQQPDQHASLPPVFLILFPIFWLGMMGWWVFVLVITIVYGIKAGRGEWADYPLVGRLARSILKIGPSASALL